MTKVKLLLLIVIGANFLDIGFTYGGQHQGGGSPGETGHQGGGNQGGGHQGGGQQGGGQQGGGQQGGGQQGGGHQGGGHQGGGQQGGGQQGGGQQGGGQQGGGQQGGGQQGGGQQGDGQQGGVHQGGGHQGGGQQGGGHQGSGQQGGGHQGSGHQGGGHQGGGHQGGWHQGGGHQGGGHQGGWQQGGGHQGHQGGLAAGLSGMTLDRESVPRCLLEEVSSFLTENGAPESSNVTSHIPRCRLDHSFDCHQQWPALGLSWRAGSQGRMMANTLTKGKPNCPLKKVSRKALVCVHGEKIIHCKRGTTLSFLDIKLSRSAAPGHLCHHRGRNEENSTLPSDHRCNATKVIGKIRKRCQGRRECWINLNERYLGTACVMEVKFLWVNFTCDQRDNNVTEESEIEDAMYSRWDDMDDICTDDDTEDTNDDVDFDDDDDIIRSSGDSGIDPDRDDYDDSLGDYNDDDDDDDNYFLDDNHDVGDTFEDGVVHFRSMNILGSGNLLIGMDRGEERERQYCLRLNWLKEPDLYKEYDFNPPSVCPKNEPLQSKCSPNLCKLVKCGDHKNVTCRVNPCGYCRPECYDANGNRVQSPRALTKCEKERLEIKYRYSDEIRVVPRCNEDGSFAEIQCLQKVNKCWCVDEHGRERNGTRQTGKPRNCKASGPVLSSCQSSILNIKNLKKHLRKMAANFNETAKTLKSKAENMTQRIQQQPNQQRNRSGRHHQRYIRHQMNRERMCRLVAKKTMKSVKYIAEPKCGADGNYETIQCESLGKWCWCVNENGKRVGSMKLLKELNCSSTDEGRGKLCPSASSFGSGAGQNIQSSCRNDSDCSDSQLCCKTSQRERGCVDPPPKMPEIKPGRCPDIPNSMNYSCPSKCRTDADCREDMKCCGMGCGKRCIPANKPVCPKGKPFKLCIYDKCLSSPGCPSHPSACCRMNYCGGCTAEYFDENGRKIDCDKATQCQKQRHAATENYKRKFLQVYGAMPNGVPGSHQQRNTTMQARRHRGNQGGRQEDDHGRRHWSGNRGGHGGMLGGDDRGEHDNQQRGNGGSQGGTQSGLHSAIQHSSQNSSDGRQRGGGDKSGQGQGSGGDHSRSREEDGGTNSGEQNEPAGGRGRQNRDQRRQPDLGIFIPECNLRDGTFLAEQCNFTAGVCWCVDEKGHEKPNTRARVQPGTRDCKVALTKSSEQSKGVRHGPKTKGNRKTKRVGKISIRLEGNFDEVLKNKDKFINNFKEAVVRGTKVKKEQIQNVGISRGSIKVQFEIVEEEDSAPLEEIVENLETVVKSKAFVVKMDDKEYRSDGTFHAGVHNHRSDDTADAVHKRQLSSVEAIAIGFCAAACLLGTAVFVWKFYCRGRKKLEPEGWKDMVEKKPPEIQFYTPDVVPAVTTNMTSSCKVPQFSRGNAVEAMPEPSI